MPINSPQSYNMPFPSGDLNPPNALESAFQVFASMMTAQDSKVMEERKDLQQRRVAAIQVGAADLLPDGGVRPISFEARTMAKLAEKQGGRGYTDAKDMASVMEAIINLDTIGRSGFGDNEREALHHADLLRAQIGIPGYGQAYGQGYGQGYQMPGQQGQGQMQGQGQGGQYVYPNARRSRGSRGMADVGDLAQQTQDGKDRKLISMQDVQGQALGIVKTARQRGISVRQLADALLKNPAGENLLFIRGMSDQQKMQALTMAIQLDLQ